MSRSKNRKIADLVSGGTFDDGVVAASEVIGLHTVASTGNFNELENKPAPFDPATLAGVAVSGSFNDLSDQPAPFDPSTLGTASTQTTGAFATAAQGTTADAALPKAGGAMTGAITTNSTFDGRNVSVDGTKLDGIEAGATADQTAAQLLTAIKTVDGAGSGLDADTVDGLTSGSFVRSDVADTVGEPLTFNSGANIHRNSHSSGYLVGGYNNVSNSDTKSSPIYAIGTSYQPSDSNLDNMYGVGYTNSAAAYDALNTVLDGWGFYVAASGTARVGLSGATGRIYGTTLVVTGNVTAYYSDMRLKTKTRDIESALDKVCSLSGFFYVENDLAKELGYNNDSEQVALSAQDVEAVMPQATSLAPVDISTSEDGTTVSKSGENYLTVDYARLVPLLVEAIKELKAEVAELKGK